MKFVTVRDFRGKSGEIWRRLSQEKEIVITLNGRPIAVLSSVSEENLEESLSSLRRARAMAAVEAIQSQSVQRGLDKIPENEINAEIKVVRRKRRGK